MLQKYVSAENGGGMGVTVDRDATSSWETFRVGYLSHCFVLDLNFFFLNFHGTVSDYLFHKYMVSLN